MDGWMNGWISELLVLLCWATSSLSDPFAEIPLLSVPSSLRNLWYALLLWPCPELPPSYLFCSFCNLSFVCAVVKMRLADSSCNPKKHKVALWSKTTFHSAVTISFSNLQLPSRLPGVSTHHSAFVARSGANAFRHSWLQTPIAGVSHWIDQPSRSADERGC